MKKSKIVALLMVFITIISNTVPTLAGELKESVVKDIDFVRICDIKSEMNARKLELADQWDTMIKNKDIVFRDGLFELRKNQKNVSENLYIAHIIQVCNDTISVGALDVVYDGEKITYSVSNETMIELENIVSNPKKETRGKKIGRELLELSNIQMSSHTCSKERIDLITMCEDNYESLEDVYLVSSILSIASPINAWEVTAAYWINKVREGGDWDYKSKPGFKPYNKEFCAYYDGSYHHITSEYIGNFNYGYTGSYLFPLSVLYTGSYVVSGMNSADVNDWPAITDGYLQAM